MTSIHLTSLEISNRPHLNSSQVRSMRFQILILFARFANTLHKLRTCIANLSKMWKPCKGKSRVIHMVHQNFNRNQHSEEDHQRIMINNRTPHPLMVQLEKRRKLLKREHLSTNRLPLLSTRLRPMRARALRLPSCSIKKR